MKKRIAILGAGVSGLATGMKLSELGYDVKIIEKIGEIGGLARTVHKSGHTMDLGVHGMTHSTKESAYVLDYFKSIMPGKFLTIDKKTTIYWNGKLINYPLAADQMFTTMSSWESVLTIVNFVWQRIRVRTGHKIDIKSFEDWVIYNFGTSLYKIYFRDYIVKTWGIPSSELSAEWLGRRVKKLSIRAEFLKLLTRFFKELKYKEAPSGLQPPVYFYNVEGAGQLSNKMRRVIEEYNGEFIFNSHPTKIKINKESVVVKYKEGDNLKEGEFDYLVSTIPINDFIGIIEEPFPAEIKDSAKELSFRAMKMVFIILNRPQVFESQWTYFHDNEFIFTRVNEFKNIFEGFSPFGKTSLVCETTCFEGDEVWQMSDEEIYRKTLNCLLKRGFFKEDEVTDYFVKSLSHTYPIFKVDSMNKVKKALEHIDGLDNVYSIGRQGRFQYINMDECIHQGFTAADEIQSKILKKL